MQQEKREPGGTVSSTTRAGDLEVGLIDSGGDGVPLVLVHGGESDRTQFATLRERLGAGIRAISYDQRDSGITVDPPEPYTLAVLADDLVTLLDALGLQRVPLLGTSNGSPPSSFFTPAGQTAQRLRPSRTLTARTPEQSARRHEVARQHDVRDRLGEITARTLIVHGTADRLAPYAGALLMRQQMPNAELRAIEDGRHGIAVEFADELARWVREFLGVNAA